METKDYSRYMAIPYKVRGRDFNGCDCWGLVRLFLLNEFGIEIGNHSEYCYKDTEEIKRVVEEEKKKWDRVDVSRLGDVAEIQILKRDFHVGVLCHPGYILHICNERFSEMNKIDSPLLKRGIKAYWRYKGTQ